MKKILFVIVFALLLSPLSTCHAATHSVVLTWAPSADGAANPTLGYNLYRGTTSGSESSTPLNASPVAVGCTSLGTCTYTDTTVGVGTYFYTCKAILNGALSAPSNEASTAISPAPPGTLVATPQ
jgi:hypothetical protein